MGLSVLGKAASLCGRTERWLVRNPPHRAAPPKVKSKKTGLTVAPARPDAWLLVRADGASCILDPMFAAAGHCARWST
jgi:hypothetical protein